MSKCKVAFTTSRSLTSGGTSVLIVFFVFLAGKTFPSPNDFAFLIRLKVFKLSFFVASSTLSKT